MKYQVYFTDASFNKDTNKANYGYYKYGYNTKTEKYKEIKSKVIENISVENIQEAEMLAFYLALKKIKKRIKSNKDFNLLFDILTNNYVIVIDSDYVFNMLSKEFNTIKTKRELPKKINKKFSFIRDNLYYINVICIKSHSSGEKQIELARNYFYEETYFKDYLKNNKNFTDFLVEGNRMIDEKVHI